MIQLSTLPVTTTENALKSVLSSIGTAGSFGGLLALDIGALDAAPDMGLPQAGKALPESGNFLPDTLPGDGETAELGALLQTDQPETQAQAEPHQLSSRSALLAGFAIQFAPARPAIGPHGPAERRTEDPTPAARTAIANPGLYRAVPSPIAKVARPDTITAPEQSIPTPDDLRPGAPSPLAHALPPALPLDAPISVLPPVEDQSAAAQSEGDGEAYITSNPAHVSAAAPALAKANRAGPSALPVQPLPETSAPAAASTPVHRAAAADGPSLPAAQTNLAASRVSAGPTKDTALRPQTVHQTASSADPNAPNRAAVGKQTTTQSETGASAIPHADQRDQLAVATPAKPVPAQHTASAPEPAEAPSPPALTERNSPAESGKETDKFAPFSQTEQRAARTDKDNIRTAEPAPTARISLQVSTREPVQIALTKPAALATDDLATNARPDRRFSPQTAENHQIRAADLPAGMPQRRLAALDNPTAPEKSVTDTAGPFVNRMVTTRPSASATVRPDTAGGVLEGAKADTATTFQPAPKPFSPANAPAQAGPAPHMPSEGPALMQPAMGQAALGETQSADGQPAVRPHEFALLVDRLVEARETVRNASASLSVMHDDFGEISLRFSQQGSGLSVSMANDDPDFARAVNAATPAEKAAEKLVASDPQLPSDRRDGNGQAGTSRMGGDAQASAGDGGARGKRDDAQTRQDNPHSQPRKHDGNNAGPNSQRGIFA